MMFNKRFGFVALFAAALLIGPAPTMADLITTGEFFLNQSNTFADGVNYGQVNIEANATTGVVSFIVDAFNVQPLYGQLNNFGIDIFGFNFANLTSTPGDWLDLTLPTGWGQSPPPPEPTLDGFGKFMVAESQGGGGDEQDPLAFSFRLPTAAEAIASNFSSVLSTGTADQGNVLFAAHVRGISAPGDVGSHWIGGSTPTPTPSAGLLGIIGLAMVGSLRRRTD